MIQKYIGNIEVFKEKIEKRVLFKKDISILKIIHNGDEIFFGNVMQLKKMNLLNIIVKKPYRYFFCIDEGRFNTKTEGKRKLLMKMVT